MSLFTIEQYELIRRLRDTGISREQLIDAFRQFDQLDSPGQTSAVSRVSSMTLSSKFRPQSITKSQVQIRPRSNPTPVRTNSNNSSVSGLPASTDVAQVSNGTDLVTAEDNTAARQQSMASYSGSRMSQAYRYSSHENYSSDMRSILKTAAGANAGISRTTSSPSTAEARPTEGTPRSQLRPKTKSRFIFKKAHIAVLENFFDQNQYPDHVQRFELAEACNKACPSSIQFINGTRQPASVTPPMVLNWFSNKRKTVRPELRKRRGHGWNTTSHQVLQADGFPTDAGTPNISRSSRSSTEINDIGDDWASRMLYDITASAAPPSANLQATSSTSDTEGNPTMKLEIDEDLVIEEAPVTSHSPEEAAE